MTLSFQQFQLLFHLRPADLRIAGRRLNGGSPFHRHMPEIIGHLFQAPSRFTRTMSKIVTQVMKAKVGNQFPLLMVGLLFERAKPVVNAILAESVTALGGEDVGAGRIATPMVQ